MTSSHQASPPLASNEISPTAALVEVTRGTIVESRHRGHVVSVNGSGELIAYLGSPDTVTYLRSSAKPFQAIPLVASGAADRFGLTEQELAIACASHNGEPIHTAAVLSILNKIGLPPAALKCGTHEPFSAAETRKLRERGEEPNVLHNNCSGKHAGMLALALHLGAPTESYDQLDSPVQVSIRNVIQQFSGVTADALAIGIDGCGVPVFGMSVRAMALMYARMVAPPATFDDSIRTACARIVSAMTSYPELIGGTTERLDTEMMRAARGRVISKVGAEGVYTVGVLPCGEWPNGMGLALKIEDGENFRARPTVVIEALRQLGVLQDESLSAVAPYARFVVRNRRGDEVGEVRAAFDLARV
jgi:L-asparaginase II